MVTQLPLLIEVEAIEYKENRPVSRENMERVGRVISLGAGLQSSVLAEQAFAGELDVDLIVFADTGCEPPWVYEQVWYLAEKAIVAKIPFKIASRPGGGLIADSQNPEHKKFAKMPLYTIEYGKKGKMRRQCTKEYKIEPFSRVVRQWLFKRGYALQDSIGRIRVNSQKYVDVLLGITWDELERVRYNGYPKWQNPIYPFVDQHETRDGCTRWLQERQLRVPEKSSCYVCPFHTDSFWRFLRDKTPKEWGAACEFDDWLRTDAEQYYLRNMRAQVFLHRSCVPLKDIDFDKPLPMFNDEQVCGGGHCHV